MSGKTDLPSQESLPVLRRRAEAGDAESSFRLAWHHFCAGNERKAVAWCELGVRQGGYWAMWLLGLCYMQGFGMPKDLKQAHTCWFEAAKRGHGLAQHFLGWSYEQGVGTSSDPVQAYRWYRSAAMQGVPESQEALSKYYEHGCAVARDAYRAYAWKLVRHCGTEAARQPGYPTPPAGLDAARVRGAQRLAGRLTNWIERKTRAR